MAMLDVVTVRYCNQVGTKQQNVNINNESLNACSGKGLGTAVEFYMGGGCTKGAVSI